MKYQQAVFVHYNLQPSYIRDTPFHSLTRYGPVCKLTYSLYWL